MEDHPIMFAALIIVWTFVAAYNILKAIVIVSIALYKWIAKKVQERQVNNLAGAKHL